MRPLQFCGLPAALVLVVGLASAATAAIQCGNHWAESCQECGKDWTWCNGACEWSWDESACLPKPRLGAQAAAVDRYSSARNHKASTDEGSTDERDSYSDRDEDDYSDHDEDEGSNYGVECDEYDGECIEEAALQLTMKNGADQEKGGGTQGSHLSGTCLALVQSLQHTSHTCAHT